MTESEYNQKIMAQNIELAGLNASLNSIQVLHTLYIDDKIPSDIKNLSLSKIKEFVESLNVIKAS